MIDGRAPARMTALILAMALAVAAAAPAARAASAANRGRQIFDTRCVFCHGTGLGHPAWQMLALKRGKDKAEILGRPDLTPAYIKHVVRNGLIEMPPFRPSEISDSELDALANYVINPNASADTKRP
ncbi:MAG TPA: cytochrome c [Candidatus Binataceae bacterium]|nr:cytochrome c [Candidatus Binataceae bacterium]